MGVDIGEVDEIMNNVWRDEAPEMINHKYREQQSRTTEIIKDDSFSAGHEAFTMNRAHELRMELEGIVTDLAGGRTDSGLLKRRDQVLAELDEILGE